MKIKLTYHCYSIHHVNKQVSLDTKSGEKSSGKQESQAKMDWRTQQSYEDNKTN